MIKKTFVSLRGFLSLFVVFVSFSAIVVQGSKLNAHAETQQPVTAFVNVNVVPFDSELRKMLENVAALNRQDPQANSATTGKFPGTWTLDKANSEGLPPDMDQLMTVVQSGDKLSLETKLIGAQGEQVIPDNYILDGKEVDFTPRGMGGQTGKGKRIAKLSADGNSIEVTENATFETPEGTLNVKATRKWTLSPDGKTLKIDMTVAGPNGEQVLKRTFIRK